MQQLPKLDPRNLDQGRQGRNRRDQKYNSFTCQSGLDAEDLDTTRMIKTGRIPKRPDLLTAHKQTRPGTIDNSFSSKEATTRTNSSFN